MWVTECIWFRVARIYWTRIESTIWHHFLRAISSCNTITNEIYTYLLDLQVKEAEKHAMIEGIRENGSEAAEFVIRKVTESRSCYCAESRFLHGRSYYFLQFHTWPLVLYFSETQKMILVFRASLLVEQGKITFSDHTNGQFSVLSPTTTTNPWLEITQTQKEI